MWNIMKLSLFSNLGVLSSIPVGRMMVAFDMTYLLQISGHHYNRKTDTANLVGGAWTLQNPQNAMVLVEEDMVDLQDIKPATDMLLVLVSDGFAWFCNVLECVAHFYSVLYTIHYNTLKIFEQS